MPTISKFRSVDGVNQGPDDQELGIGPTWLANQRTKKLGCFLEME